MPDLNPHMSCVQSQPPQTLRAQLMEYSLRKAGTEASSNSAASYPHSHAGTATCQRCSAALEPRSSLVKPQTNHLLVPLLHSSHHSSSARGQTPETATKSPLVTASTSLPEPLRDRIPVPGTDQLQTGVFTLGCGAVRLRGHSPLVLCHQAAFATCVIVGLGKLP